MKTNSTMKKITTTIALSLAVLTTHAQEHEWSLGQGIAGYNTAAKSVVDPIDGSVYITATRGVNDFDPGAGVFTGTGNGGTDFFLQKLDADKNFLWAQYIGGPDMDYSFDITLANDGGVIVVGSGGDQCDLDPGTGTNILTTTNLRESFVAKYASNGAYEWGNFPTSSGSDNIATNVTTDNDGNIIVVGSFSTTMDIAGPTGPITLTSNGGNDGYVWKLNSTGVTQWVYSYGGTSSEESGGIACDSDGNVYFGARFAETIDFDPTGGFLNVTSNGNVDAVIGKLNGMGEIQWAHGFGSTSATSFDNLMGVGVDSNDDIYAFGAFKDSINLNFGAGVNSHISNGNTDNYLLKIDPDANYIWSVSYGGTGGCEAHDLAIDEFDNVYVTGSVAGLTDFDPSANVNELNTATVSGTYFSKFSVDGTYKFTGAYGGASLNRAESVSVDNNGNVLLSGMFGNTHFFTPTDSIVTEGSQDQFVAKFSQVDVTVSQDLLELTAESEFAQNYQWIDCNTGAPIAGETNAVYNATVDGSYAVIATNGNAVDTSDCIVIAGVGIQESELENSISVYPNPTQNQITISSAVAIEEVKLFDVLGNLITTKNLNKIDLSTLPNGIYLVQISTEQGKVTKRVVKR